MYNIPVCNGEIIDKYTILEIKLQKINNKDKIEKVRKEHKLLEIFVDTLKNNFNISDLIKQLKLINLKLWEIEDDIRKKESIQDFNQEFIILSRSVYFTNDRRFEVKLQINTLTNSNISEVKSYQKYTD